MREPVAVASEPRPRVRDLTTIPFRNRSSSDLTVLRHTANDWHDPAASLVPPADLSRLSWRSAVSQEMRSRKQITRSRAVKTLI